MTRLTDATGVGRAAMLATVLVGLAALTFGAFDRVDTWTNSMFAVVTWHAGSMLLAGIAGAGIAAYSAALLRRSTLGTLAEIGARGEAAVLRVGLGVGVLLAAVAVVGLLMYVLVARSTGLRGGLPLTPLLGTIGMLVALPIVGAAAGWMTRSVLAAPLVMPLTFFGIDLLSAWTGRLLEFGSVTDGIGIGPSVRFDLLQPVALSCVAGVALILVSHRPAVVRSAGVVVLAGALLGLGTVAPDPVVAVSSPVACGGSAVRVCGSPDRRLRFEDVSRELAAYERPLRPLLPADLTLPNEYREHLFPPTVTVGSLDVVNAHRRVELAYAVINGVTRCYDPVEGPPEGPESDAESLVAGWVVTRGRRVAPPPGLEGTVYDLPKNRAKAADQVSKALRTLKPCGA